MMMGVGVAYGNPNWKNGADSRGCFEDADGKYHVKPKYSGTHS